MQIKNSNTILCLYIYFARKSEALLDAIST